MLHQPLTADPDVEQAIQDFLPIGEEIRRLSKAALDSRQPPAHRVANEAEIRQRIADLNTRGERIGISGAALLELINAELDRKARRGRGEPARPTSRTLLTALIDAESGLAEAQWAQVAATKALRLAQERRDAAAEAYQVYAAGRETNL